MPSLFYVICVSQEKYFIFFNVIDRPFTIVCFLKDREIWFFRHFWHKIDAISIC